jgi:hypothetical protein
MFSDHINVEQSKTLSIKWNDDHCGNKVRAIRKEVALIIGTSRRRSSRANISSKGLGGSSDRRICLKISCQ